MTADVLIWLQERTILGRLSEQVLLAIAQVLQPLQVSAGQILIQEGTPPLGVYLLLSGKLAGECPSGQMGAVSYLPGAILHLQELLLGQAALRTLKTMSDCEFWFIPAIQVQQLVAQYPEINQILSQQLALEVAQLTARLTYEQERQSALRPYLVTKASRGIIGRSRYAVRLRQQINQASKDRRSVLIFGEPGLEKDNIAALIHFGSAERREPMIKLNCGTLQASGAELFGRSGGKPGLLEWLGQGTLLLNNIQELPPSLFAPLAKLLQTSTYSPVARPGVRFEEEEQRDQEATPVLSAPLLTSQARIILISEKTQSIDRLVGHSMKVPPLRVRKADIRDQVDYYISLCSRARGIPKMIMTPEALRRLQSYDFPGNLRELSSLVERAIVQSMLTEEGAVSSDRPRPLTEELVWSSESKKQRFRLNLLNAYPWLRRFLRSPWWPDRINYGFTLWFFVVIVAVLFVAPQTRDQNFALNLFWAWWWPLVLIGFPFVGRLWCAVCPFMIYGEVTQKLSLWLFPRSLQRWPREQAERWGGWFLFGLFALIFLWEELWDLENTAYLSAWLLLLITGGAMICSAIFERRFWCRYLCPIGGMNGLFAKLSMTELRAQQGTCSAECSTYQCYKGGPQKGEGLETAGCPLYSHPAQLEDNRDCVLCMTCLKACPHRSVEVNLRPPGIELWTTHVPRSYEVALLFLLLGGVFLHRLPELQNWLHLSLSLTDFVPHLGLSLAALTFPALVPLVSYALLLGAYRLNWMPRPTAFVKLAYGYLPLVWGATLAHYLRLGLEEGGRLLPVTFATFGWSGENLPYLVAHPAVISFLQGSVLLFSLLVTCWLMQKIARQPFQYLLLYHLSSVGLGIAFWCVILA